MFYQEECNSGRSTLPTIYELLLENMLQEQDGNQSFARPCLLLVASIGKGVSTKHRTSVENGNRVLCLRSLKKLQLVCPWT